MQVSVTMTEGLQRRMTVAVPADLIEQQVRDRLKSLAGTVRIDGFRPGKVPMSVVERRFGEKVRSEVRSDVVQRSFDDAVVREQLRPVGRPRIELGRSEVGKDLEFTATFEVFPSIDINFSAGFAIKRPMVKVEEADVDTVVERIRKQNVRWQPVDRAAQDSDRVNINFEGRLNGEPFAGGKAENFDLVLGSKTLVGDFEAQLHGSRAGSEVNVRVDFPAEYPMSELAGKAVDFTVKINSISEPVLPELNDEFFAAFGVSDGGLAAFRQQVRENIEREVKEAAKGRIKAQVVDQLVQRVPVELPKALVESEIVMRMQRARSQLAAGGADTQNVRLERDRFEPGARRAVAMGLIVSEIVRRNGLKVTGDQLRAKVEDLAASYDDPAAVVNWYYSDQNRLGDIEAVLLEDNAVDWVLQKAQIEDAPMTVMELLDPEKRAAA